MTADETNVLPFIDPPQPGMAFGCDPRRKEKFSLRQSRYVGLAESIQQIAEKQGASPQCLLQILDIGLGTGVTMRYVERLACSESLQLHGSDLKIQETMYRRENWSDLYEGDVTAGLPAIESDRFDVVVCEQVLEHVHDVDQGLATLYRVLKPGGTLLVGVPIFPPGLHWIRRHLIPILDRLNPWAKSRGHVQAFSLASFKKEVETAGFSIQTERGFRIVSGGLLRPLENHAWWYRFNRSLGKTVPGLCIETQLVAQKPNRDMTRVA